MTRSSDSAPEPGNHPAARPSPLSCYRPAAPCEGRSSAALDSGAPAIFAQRCEAGPP